MEMDFNELAKHFNGNGSEIARYFDITPGAVSHWRQINKVPELRIMQFKTWGPTKAGKPADQSSSSPASRSGGASPSN